MSMSLSHTVHPSYSCTRATTQPLLYSCPCLSPIQFTQVTAVRVPRLNHCPAHVHVSLSYSSPKLQLYACHDSTIALLMSMSLSPIQFTQVTAVRVPRLNHCPAHVHVSLSHTVHPSYSCTRAMTQPLPCSCPCLSLLQFTQVTAVRVPRLNHCPAHVHVSLSYSSPKLQLYACHNSTIALLMSMSLSLTVHPSYSCTRAMTQPLLCSCPCLSLIQFTQVTAVRVPRLNHCSAHVHVSLPYSSPKLQLYACHDSTIDLLMSMSLSPIQFTQVTAVRVPRLNHCPAHVHVSLSYSSPKLQLYACQDSTIALLMSMSLSLTVHPSYSCMRAMTQPLPCSCPCLSLPYSSPKLQLYACHDSTIALLMSMSLSHTVHPSYSCTRAMTQPLPCSCPCLSLIQFTQVTAVRVP